MTIIEGHISIPVRFILLPMAVHPRLVASECSHEEIEHDLVVIYNCSNGKMQRRRSVRY